MAPGLPSSDELLHRRPQMFPALSEAQVARVKAIAEERHCAPGEILWDQGDVDAPLFVVLEGELEIVHPWGEFEDTVTVLGPREFSGELNLLTHRRSLVRGRARGDLKVLRVDPSRLGSLVRDDSEISEVMMRAFILRRVGLLSSGMGDVVVLGARNSADTLRIQTFLLRNGNPSQYLDVDRDRGVQALFDQFQVRREDIPILICRGERVLKNPSDREVADCLGLNTPLNPEVVHDVVVCGAGPAGLSAAVYAASEGLDVLIVEASYPGGQAASSSKIENYLGFPTGISGLALANRALNQAEKFGARLAVARPVVNIHCGEPVYRIELVGGEVIRTRAIVIATGAQYRKLTVSDFERFEGVGVYYSATYLEAEVCSGQEVVVVGGGNSAGQASTFLAGRSRHVHHLVRATSLAASMSQYLQRRIEDTPNISLHYTTEVSSVGGAGRLEQVSWRNNSNGHETRHAIGHLFCMAGARPNTAWLNGWVALDAAGFVRTGSDLRPDDLASAGWPLARAPYLFETSRPRIFAVGDVRASSVKRVASAVGEGSVCVQLVHKSLSE